MMREPRSVVITGASRGLGLASATHLYKLGWRVVGAMRSPDAGLERLRAATGAAADDPRLVGIRLDLDDPSSIIAAAKTIVETVGAPDVLVHNAGIAAVGSVEEMPSEVWERLFRTNLFGPVRLTKELLPSMRAAGRGRIIVVSSQGGIRGMPSISAYSASKGALERWAEALAEEIAPFGLGVTILVSGTFKTDILTEQTPQYGDLTVRTPRTATESTARAARCAPGEPSRTFRQGPRQGYRRAGPVRPACGGPRRPHAAVRQSPPAGPTPPSCGPSGDASPASWRPARSRAGSPAAGFHRQLHI